MSVPKYLGLGVVMPPKKNCLKNRCDKKRGGGPPLVRSYFVITHGFDEFYLTIEPELEYYHQYNLLISGKKKGCVNATVYTNPNPGSRLPQANDITLGYISHIEYSKKCNTSGNLQPGQGTIKMMQALFWTVRTFFPWVLSFKFEDMSRIRCSKGNYMNLAVYSLSFHQKTWYEAKFQARKMSPTNQVMYESGKNTLLTTKTIPWSQLMFLIPIHLQQSLKPLYERSATYAEFFKDVYLIVAADRRRSCEFLQPWLERCLEIMVDGDVIKGMWMMDIASQTMVSFGYSSLSDEPLYIKYAESDDDEGHGDQRGGSVVSIYDV